MSTKKNPGAGQATGVSEDLQSTISLSHCGRCGHSISAAGSITVGLGPICRRHRARSTQVAIRLAHLAMGVERLPSVRLKVVAEALDDLDVAFEAL